ncbi:hypothetical protein BH23ACT5_BH23ACT5_19890 [soil metagenome]
MDQRTDLKRDIEERRSEISRTVDQIENRVHPGHMAARQKHRLRRKLADWKDNIMGSDESNGGLKERAGEVAETMSSAPDEVVKHTRGNPLAAGAIAVGAGALLASLLPETRPEKKLAAGLQPGLEETGSRLVEAGKDLAEDMKEVVEEGFEHVRDSASSASQGLTEDAKEAGGRIVGQED